MEKQTVMERLSHHAQNMHSDWREKAEWRRVNSSWISCSQNIAIKMLEVMRKDNLTQAVVAERMCCSQQYVSKVLKVHRTSTLLRQAQQKPR